MEQLNEDWREKANDERQQRLDRRNADIQKRYEELSEKKLHNRRMYSVEAMIATVAYEFYLSERTVSQVIFESKTS